jgi:uncharacterized protein YndB with AHSA1/START domain
MSERSIQHSSFVLERSYTASPQKVFNAFADQKAKARWFVGPNEWEKSDHKLDFRVGGKESVSGGPPGGPVHYFNATYQDIVPNQRIVYTYDMHLDKRRISVSLATMEFVPKGEGTMLILTEHGAFLDGLDWGDAREKGTKDLLANLDAALKSDSPGS